MAADARAPAAPRDAGTTGDGAGGVTEVAAASTATRSRDRMVESAPSVSSSATAAIVTALAGPRSRSGRRGAASSRRRITAAIGR